MSERFIDSTNKLDNGFSVDRIDGRIFLRAPNGKLVDGENHMVPHVFRTEEEALETAAYLHETGECSVVDGMWIRDDKLPESNVVRMRLELKIDLELLRQQKGWLISMQVGDGLDQDYIEGLLGLIDAIQDAAAEEVGGRRVFGEMEDE